MVEEFWHKIYELMHEIYKEAADEAIEKLIYGDRTGELRGIINYGYPPPQLVVHPNDFKELTKGARSFAGSLSPLLLDSLSAQASQALREQKGLHWSEEAFRVQVLRREVPMPVSPPQVQGRNRWHDHNHRA